MEVCSYCGSSRKIQQDHVRAASKGGVLTIPACATCNQSKGAKALMEWLRWVKKNKSYRWNRILKYNDRKRTVIAAKVQRVRHS